ncbi:hypothetical protein [Neolewinella agarilytica]|uniref:Uncharacterized protein n=1 Tax=Neolewinella agarilytica TaxID=478744 RepID=A0A1H9I5A4_9BACT|nr:hypothetical protein [Neolewinella agarilytica]SEQ69764.1 hypothetical protein SAMN05444359_11447 [Neolewinella agarilytica]
MSEIKSAGIKGYAILGAFIAFLLFVFLVVYLYKYNNNGVPEEPQLYSDLLTTFVSGLRA